MNPKRIRTFLDIEAEKKREWLLWQLPPGVFSSEKEREHLIDEVLSDIEEDKRERKNRREEPRIEITRTGDSALVSIEKGRKVCGRFKDRKKQHLFELMQGLIRGYAPVWHLTGGEVVNVFDLLNNEKKYQLLLENKLRAKLLALIKADKIGVVAGELLRLLHSEVRNITILDDKRMHNLIEVAKIEPCYAVEMVRQYDEPKAVLVKGDIKVTATKEQMCKILEEPQVLAAIKMLASAHTFPPEHAAEFFFKALSLYPAHWSMLSSPETVLRVISKKNPGYFLKIGEALARRNKVLR